MKSGLSSGWCVTQARWFPDGLKLADSRSSQTKLFMDRRQFLRGGVGAAIFASLPADSFAQNSRPPEAHAWDAGRLTHLLPTVSDTRILIKASFSKPLSGAP